MNTFVLATVGTSLLTNLRQRQGLADDSVPDERWAHSFLRQQDPRDHVCGAEVNSITHLVAGQRLSAGTVRPPVRLCFLVSDTPEGQWAGGVLQHYFEQTSEVEAAEYETVVGLTGTEPKRFAREGLRNLVKLAAAKLDEARREDPSALRVIDATGGYKAQISFAGLIGQALKVPVVYLFEQFPRCIEMPPLPVDFDRGLWIENFGLFQHLSEESLVPVTELPRDLDRRIGDLLDRETVDGNEYASLSPILELMHQSFLFTEPVGMAEPPSAQLAPEEKLHLNEAHMPHAPKRSRERAEQLARLPWVTWVASIGYEDTGCRWRVQTGGVREVAEILVLYGDGDMALKMRLKTTAASNAERAWCVEQLKREPS